MKIATRGKKAYIQTPYHSTFVARIKQISGARWNPKKRAWVVDVEFLPLVRQIMDEIFGESDVPAEGERYNIKLTFHTDISSRPLDGVYSSQNAWLLRITMATVPGSAMESIISAVAVLCAAPYKTG